MKKGYIQTINSVTEFQDIVTAMTKVGVECNKITVNQPFDDFIKTLDAGDVAVVYSLPDCFKNLTELINTSVEFSKRSIKLRSLTDSWYNNSPELLTLLQGVTDMTSRIRSNRTQLGLLKLKAQGKKLGRPVGTAKITERVAEVTKLHKESEMSITKACALVNCNPRSYYRYLKENTRTNSAAKI